MITEDEIFKEKKRKFCFNYAIIFYVNYYLMGINQWIRLDHRGDGFAKKKLYSSILFPTKILRNAEDSKI